MCHPRTLENVKSIVTNSPYRTLRLVCSLARWYSASGVVFYDIQRVGWCSMIFSDWGGILLYSASGVLFYTIQRVEWFSMIFSEWGVILYYSANGVLFYDIQRMGCYPKLFCEWGVILCYSASWVAFVWYSASGVLFYDIQRVGCYSLLFCEWGVILCYFASGVVFYCYSSCRECIILSFTIVQNARIALKYMMNKSKINFYCNIRRWYDINSYCSNINVLFAV